MSATLKLSKAKWSHVVMYKLISTCEYHWCKKLLKFPIGWLLPWSKCFVKFLSRWLWLAVTMCDLHMSSNFNQYKVNVYSTEFYLVIFWKLVTNKHYLEQHLFVSNYWKDFKWKCIHLFLNFGYFLHLCILWHDCKKKSYRLIIFYVL